MFRLFRLNLALGLTASVALPILGVPIILTLCVLLMSTITNGPLKATPGVLSLSRCEILKLVPSAKLSR